MTASATRSASFTLTDARYVGAKIGADLRIMHNLYGKPPLDRIDLFAEEAALLLRDGHLHTIDYGFLLPNSTAWKFRLRYTATLGGQLRDDRPGSYPTTLEVAGLGFYSYLTHSAKYYNLSPAEQEKIVQSLPIRRTGADEPTANWGTTTNGHGYGRNGTGVSRGTYTAY